MKKLISSICTLVLLINIFAPIALANGGTNVVFTDEKLKNAIIDLGHDANGDGELSQNEMESITELVFGSRGITDLNGLEYAINLKTLNIDGNSITDLTPILNLDKLVNKYIGGQSLTFDLGTVKVGDKLELDIPLICKQLNLETIEYYNTGLVGMNYWEKATLNEDGTKIILDTSSSVIYEDSQYIYQKVDGDAYLLMMKSYIMQLQVSDLKYIIQC